ncbi:hypothetical protein FRACYDRAFT_272697 [Fragilariopsis cylindrus CCMP1102]|uniref:Uncharacterized protein n=1 Tax=Fragilariopsis cylindrus CCMP1102 TaxID=635003 RepID=A0A1E7EM54_9STRA|nr:hypothetical protein FRACYDRAFT_272697 [Fragilariopsis cylindrus CCMP1102]|eukprot:OEU06653.1 hypothetical protein FRACYDRAFT_272697 [Fragilariopsis cylindrus CCMP1102]
MYLPTPNPIQSDHLLLMKQQQQRQRQRQQRQPLITMKRKKKSVCFFGVVFVKPYEKASSQEAVDIWYTDEDMALFKKEGRDMTVSYRNLTTSTTHNNTKKDDNEKDNKDLSMYRGFEYGSIRRQKHKIVANRCVLYAQRQGMTARHIASVYRKANGWFTDVAFLQAVHDCIELYDDTNNNSNGSGTVNKNNKGPPPQQEMMRMTTTLPSVAAMIPPRLFPFAMKSALALRKTTTGNKRTTSTPTTTTNNIVTSIDDQKRRKRQRRALFLLK